MATVISSNAYIDGINSLSSIAAQPYASVTYLQDLEQKQEKQKKESKTMIQNVKNYVEKHRDIIFTVGFIFLVDHFMFKGALRDRLKGMIEGVISKVEKEFHKEA